MRLKCHCGLSVAPLSKAQQVRDADCAGHVVTVAVFKFRGVSMHMAAGGSSV